MVCMVWPVWCVCVSIYPTHGIAPTKEERGGRNGWKERGRIQTRANQKWMRAIKGLDVQAERKKTDSEGEGGGV
jgi:hypothetical protein